MSWIRVLRATVPTMFVRGSPVGGGSSQLDDQSELGTGEAHVYGFAPSAGRTLETMSPVVNGMLAHSRATARSRCSMGRRPAPSTPPMSHRRSHRLDNGTRGQATGPLETRRLASAEQVTACKGAQDHCVFLTAALTGAATAFSPPAASSAARSAARRFSRRSRPSTTIPRGEVSPKRRLKMISISQAPT